MYAKHVLADCDLFVIVYKHLKQLTFMSNMSLSEILTDPGSTITIKNRYYLQNKLAQKTNETPVKAGVSTGLNPIPI